MAVENKLRTKTQDLLLVALKRLVKHKEHPSEEEHAFGDI